MESQCHSSKRTLSNCSERHVYDKDGNQVADIPVSAGDEIYADYYTIRDTLNEKILLDGLTVNTKTDSSDWVALEFGTDYTVLD